MVRNGQTSFTSSLEQAQYKPERNINKKTLEQKNEKGA